MQDISEHNHQILFLKDTIHDDRLVRGTSGFHRVLSLFFGDALLYWILPVHADVFGVSMLMLGLLAVNRIIRTFAYGLIAELSVLG